MLFKLITDGSDTQKTPSKSTSTRKDLTSRDFQDTENGEIAKTSSSGTSLTSEDSKNDEEMMEG